MKGLIVHPVVREHMCGILKVLNVVPNGDPRYKHCIFTDCHSQCLVVENNKKTFIIKLLVGSLVLQCLDKEGVLLPIATPNV